MGNNRTAGVVLTVVGIGWVATWPAFLWWMDRMEGNALGPDRPDETAWRLWRALETLLVEPRWLAITIAVLMLGAFALGSAILAVGIQTLRGKVGTPKWPALVTVSGIVFCLIGFVFYWALLMPVVNASENLDVARASGDLNLAIPVALGAGLGSMIVVGLVLLGGRRQIAPAGNLPQQTL